MILRSLTVRNFAGLVPGAKIPVFHDRITVIHGPNEAGKSTLLRAIEFALFQRHDSKGEDVRGEVESVGRSLAAEVSLDFETKEGSFRIYKRLVKKDSAKLSRLERGTFVDFADDKEADEQLRQILGGSFSKKGRTKPDAYGTGQILLAGQGELVLTGLGEEAQDRLRAAVGRVTINETTRGIERRAIDRYERIYTPEGRLKSGAQAPEVVHIRERKERTLEARSKAKDDVIEAERQSERLRDAEKAMAEHDGAMDRAVNDLAQAEKERKAAAELDKSVLGLKADRDARIRDRDALHISISEIEAAVRKIASLERDHEEARKQQSIAASDLDVADERLQKARKGEEHLADDRRALEALEAEARDARRRLELLTSIEQKKKRLLRYEKLESEAKDLRDACTKLAAPSAKELKTIRKLTEEIASMERDLRELSLTVRIRAEKDLSVERGDGSRASIPSGGDETVAGDAPLRFRLEGVASFDVLGPTDAEKRREIVEDLARKKKKLSDATARFAVNDLEALEDLERKGRTMENDLEAKEAQLKEIDADADEVREEKRQLGRDEAELDAILARRPAYRDSGPEEEAVATLEGSAERMRREFDRIETGVKAKAREAEKLREDARTVHEMRSSEVVRLEATLKSDREQLRQKRSDGLTDESRRAALAAAEGRLRDAEARLGAAMRERDALPADSEAAVDRCKKLIGEMGAAGKRRIEAETAARLRLEQINATAPYRRLAESEETLVDLDAAEAGATVEIEAVKILKDLLEKERRAEIDEVLAPVKSKVERMMRYVLGDHMGITIDETFLPGAFPRETGGALTSEQLSYGTRDQIALLVRIAYAEMIAAEQGRHALILDDPLVNADAGRRRRFLEILERAARDLQIVIFTCHPEHYAGLLEKLDVDMEEAKRGVSAAPFGIEEIGA